MVKFAKYLFLIFTVSLILPLLCLFIYSNRQITKMELDASRHILDSISRETSYNIENYLKIETVNAMKKLYLPKMDKVSKNEIAKIFPDAKVEFLTDFPDEITYYYKIDNIPKLYSVSIIPFLEEEIKGIKITKEVTTDKLRQTGPYYLELYAGDTIRKENLIGYSNPDKIPKSISGFKKIKHLPLGIPKDNNISYKVFTFDKKYAKDKITVLIKTSWHIPHANPYERRAVLFIIIAGILLSFFIARYININFINPFIKLSAASKRVKSGDLNLILKTGVKQKTVQETCNNFNDMVKGLKEKEELRSGFIRNLTHDLRTPLVAQERALSLISNKFKELNLKEEMELSKSLEKNTSHLLRMVNLILESYQFNLKKEDLNFETTDLAQLINDSFIKIKPLADEKNIALLNTISEGKIHITTDKTCIERIIINLAANSIDNLKKNGEIKISAYQNDNECKVFVKDNGNGISNEDMEHIFDRYYSSKSYNRKLGSGLGLDVCKKLTELLGGRIEIESEIDKYTKFTLTLPNIKQHKENKQ